MGSPSTGRGPEAASVAGAPVPILTATYEVPETVWVPRPFRGRWIAGNFVQLSLAIAFGEIFSFWLTGTYGHTEGTLFIFATVDCLALGFSSVLYLLLAPPPAPDLLLAPDGVRFGRAIRGRAIPWSDVGLVGRMLYTTPGRWRPRGQYSLDPMQRAWLRAYMDARAVAPRR